MLAFSPKGTVPVLVLPSGEVLDESLAIMQWAFSQDSVFTRTQGYEVDSSDQYALIEKNDTQLKYWLDRYKYSDRHPNFSASHYRSRAEAFLGLLECRLRPNPYLFGETPGLADLAIFPFIRQFAGVDPAWFNATSYSAVKSWLGQWCETSLFKAAMQKYPPWQTDDSPISLVSARGFAF
ncbi:MAG: glutathione S-transferase [Lentisphaeria bacterium]|jgi:glutathione S-transferase